MAESALPIHQRGSEEDKELTGNTVVRATVHCSLPPLKVPKEATGMELLVVSQN